MIVTFVKSLLNRLPDGILLDLADYIFVKLFGKIPPEKRKELRDELATFIVNLSRALAEGAAKGGAEGIKGNN